MGCDASCGWLSSYDLVIMTIYFLQVKKGVPSLQAIYPDHNWSEGGVLPEVACLQSLSDSMESSEPWFSHFFDFYANQFQWGHEIVSIRLGRRLSRSDPAFSKLKRVDTHLDIEDPFLVNRNLGAHIRSKKKLERFREAVGTMAKSHRVKHQFETTKKDPLIQQGPCAESGAHKQELAGVAHVPTLAVPPKMLKVGELLPRRRRAKHELLNTEGDKNLVAQRKPSATVSSQKKGIRKADDVPTPAPQELSEVGVHQSGGLVQSTSPEGKFIVSLCDKALWRSHEHLRIIGESRSGQSWICSLPKDRTKNQTCYMPKNQEGKLWQWANACKV